MSDKNSPVTDQPEFDFNYLNFTQTEELRKILYTNYRNVQVKIKSAKVLELFLMGHGTTTIMITHDNRIVIEGHDSVDVTTLHKWFEIALKQKRKPGFYKVKLLNEITVGEYKFNQTINEFRWTIVGDNKAYTDKSLDIISYID